MYQDLHLYIDLDWEKYVENPTAFLKNLLRIVEKAYQYKATVYYSPTQLKEFIDNCGDLDEYFSSSQANTLDLILKYAIKRNDQKYVFKIVYAGKNTRLEYIDNKAISSLLKHYYNAFITASQDENKYEVLAVTANGLIEKIDYDAFNSVPSVLRWMNSSKERTFNVSAKHGENGVGNWANASPLLCSGQAAQLLLDRAIADFQYVDRKLFHYDEKHQTYIQFYYEGNTPQHQWHGFHLRIEHWSRVPPTIRKYYNR